MRTKPALFVYTPLCPRLLALPPPSSYPEFETTCPAQSKRIDRISPKRKTPIMPFRFSDFMKRGKLGNPYSDRESSSRRPSTSESSPFVGRRPTTANSYDFRPEPRSQSQVSQGPPPIPRRSSLRPAPPPSSFPTHKMPSRAQYSQTYRPELPVPSYDNGTGRLSPEFLEQNNLPPTIKTTAQLADFIKSQEQPYVEVRPGSSASNYSQPSYGASTHFSYGGYRDRSRSRGRSEVRRMPRIDSGYAAGSIISSYEHTSAPSNACKASRERSQTRTIAPGPAARICHGAHHPRITMARSLHRPKPISRVLPGNMRQSRFENFWFERGSVRGVKNLTKEKKAWRKRLGCGTPTYRGTFQPTDFDTFKQTQQGQWMLQQQEKRSKWYDSDDEA
jgi:hypothetical protein